jgi:hypothetical protein
MGRKYVQNTDLTKGCYPRICKELLKLKNKITGLKAGKNYEQTPSQKR